MSDPAVLREKFFSFEKEHCLFDRTIAAGKFWDYVRREVHEDIANKAKAQSQAVWPADRFPRNRIKELAVELFSHLPEVFRAFTRLIDKRRDPCDLVVFDCDIKELVEGKRAYPYSYYFVKQFSQAYKVRLFDSSVLSDSAGGAYPCDVESTRCYHIISVVIAKFYRFSARDREELNKIAVLIKGTFGVDCDVVGIIRDFFISQVFMKSFVKNSLRRACPRLVVIIYNGKKYHVQASHELGIKVIELQHGAIARNDLFHSYPEVAPAAIDTVQDYMFTFGQYWNDRVISSMERIAVGSMVFENKMKAIRCDEIKRDKKSILGVSTMDHEMARCLFEFSLNHPDYKVYYKLRSDEYPCWKKLYPEEMTARENFIFIDQDSRSIYEYLLEVEYVVSTCSTALYEGLHLGAKALIFTGVYHEFVDDLVENGYAMHVSNCQDLVDIIVHDNFKGSIAQAEIFYRSHPVKNMSEELTRLLK